MSTLLCRRLHGELAAAQRIDLLIRAEDTALSSNASVATQLALLTQQLQAVNASQLSDFPASSDFWQAVRLEVTAPHQDPVPCLPSCKVRNGRGEARQI